MPFQNRDLKALIPRGNYGSESLSLIETALRTRGTFEFPRFPSGLFPASPAGKSIIGSGYENVWVRDNVYIAYAHHLSGQTPVAADVAHKLLAFFYRYRHRFEDIISGVVDPQNISNRPHVRFNGDRLEEISNERWAHAQNDALGYFLWLYTKLAYDGHVALDERAISTLALFPRYFEAIHFWEDEDSGHWEEMRKISASSIGTVVAGLDALLALARKCSDIFQARTFGAKLVSTTISLVNQGRIALDKILPNECIQSPPQKRDCDAALLFLLFPLNVIRGQMADTLINNINRFLKGNYGIRRYQGDSYWAPDYETLLPQKQRTADFSEKMEVRDALLKKKGGEAQWCIFDPIVSTYYGRRFLETRSPSDLKQQTAYFNRALAQITTSWHCPELYYLQHDKYTPNPHVPLLWAQANLIMALEMMKSTASASVYCHVTSRRTHR